MELSVPQMQLCVDHILKTETQKVSNVIIEPEVQRTYVQYFL